MKLKILRTGAGSLPSPPVIRGLRALGCHVIAADADSMAVGFHCADDHVVIPRADDASFTDRIVTLCRERGIDAVIPAVNEEISPLVAARAVLEEHGTRVVAPSARTVETCLDKWQTREALTSHGLHTPRTWLGTDAGSVTFPAILKPRRGRGSRGVVAIQDPTELQFHLDRAPEPVVIQEHLSGDEFTVDVFADADGVLRMASVRRRLRVNAGISVAGEIVSPDPFLAPLETLTRALGLIGPSCVQFFMTPDGPCFFDLNPRLGGGVALSLEGGTPILAGILAMLRGDEIPTAIGVGVGLRFLRQYEEVYLT